MIISHLQELAPSTRKNYAQTPTFFVWACYTLITVILLIIAFVLAILIMLIYDAHEKAGGERRFC